MNRWTGSALAVLILGLVLAFFVVPFDDGACPAVGRCDAVGAIPRITTVVVSVFVALVLGVIGSAGSEHGHRA